MTLLIREAVAADAPTILRFIRELAIYENAEHEVKATVESITASIFGEGSVTSALICEREGRPIGFAVWFLSYSTWLSRNWTLSGRPLRHAPMRVAPALGRRY